MIGTFIFTAVILILDHATLLLSSGNKDQALPQAQIHYIQFGLPIAAAKFPAAFQEYSDAEFLQVILNNCCLAK